MSTPTVAPPFLVLAPYDRPPLIWGTERWLLSDRPGQASTVPRGPFAGATLTDLVDRLGARLTGGAGLRPDGRLRLLLKLLQTHDRLSVQVHPGHEHLSRLPPTAESKEEAWLVLGVLPGARIYLGARPGCTPVAFDQALQRGRVEDELAWFEPTVGDVVHVRPGTLHAIGAGLTLAEVQESSDTTYRVWDWGRLEDGRPRTLHLDEARQVLRFEGVASSDRRVGGGALPKACTELLQVAPFRMAWRVGGGSVAAPRDAFVACTLLSGSAEVVAGSERARVEVGETVFVPPGAAPMVSPGPAAAFLEVSTAAG